MFFYSAFTISALISAALLATMAANSFERSFSSIGRFAPSDAPGRRRRRRGGYGDAGAVRGGTGRRARCDGLTPRGVGLHIRFSKSTPLSEE